MRLTKGIKMEKFRHAVLVGATLLMSLSSHSAFADCRNLKDSIFTDDFSDALGGWDPDESIAIGSGVALQTIKKGKVFNQELNNSFLVRDADICVTMTFPDTAKLAKRGDNLGTSHGGIIFAASDYKNSFAVKISSNGFYELYRVLDNARQDPIVPWTASSAIKTGLGEQNQIEITLVANVFTLLINGQKLTALRIQIDPTQVKKFGFVSQLDDPATEDVQFAFRNFVVNQPK